jgi:hypothetical protein
MGHPPTRGKEKLNMQVAELYLRGKLPNYTGKNLNREQARDVDKITKRLVEDPKIASHKSEFKKQLARTIKGEYRDLPDAAETEFWIAAWRAILFVAYHTPLECKAFGPVEVNGKSLKGKKIIYDEDIIEIGEEISILVGESLPIPPEHTLHICTKHTTTTVTTNPRGLLCIPDHNTKYVVTRNGEVVFGPAVPGLLSHRTKITGMFGTFCKKLILPGDKVIITEGRDAGATATVDSSSFTSFDMGIPHPVVFGSKLSTMKTAYSRLRDDYSPAQGSPQYVVIPSLRPVHMIVRSRRAVPHIIFDDIQLRKLVKNYGWEFFGQILKENKRPMIKSVKVIRDSADTVALRLVESLFTTSKESIKFEIDQDNKIIKTETYLLPMPIVRKIADIKREFLANKVDVQVIEGKGIKIRSMGQPPTISKKITEVRFNNIRSFDEHGSHDPEKTVRSILESQIADKHKISSHFESVSSKLDIAELIEKLPESTAQYIMMLIDPPKEFFDTYGHSTRKSDIADFLGVHVNELKKHERIIKLQMLALGMGPGSANIM